MPIELLQITPLAANFGNKIKNNLSSPMNYALVKYQSKTTRAKSQFLSNRDVKIQQLMEEKYNAKIEKEATLKTGVAKIKT